MNEILVSISVLGGIGAVLAIALELVDRFIANYGEVRIDINDSSRELVAEGGSSLLNILGSKNIFIPSACGGRGSCGYCKVKVVEGGGPVLPTETGWLDKDELMENVRLSCQLKVREDLKIKIPKELFLIKEYQGVVEQITDLTHDIKEIHIRLVEPDTIEFKTGQYMQLSVPEYGDVDESVYRAYSLSSSEYDNHHVEFLIRYVPEGICTTWVHQFLKEGQTVIFNGPHGEFYLRDTDKPIIMIAGGSGLAPFKGMLEKMAADKNPRPTKFFFGAVNKSNLYHLDLMARLEQELPNFKFIPALSHPDENSDWKGETGLITEVVERLAKNISGSEAYLCGSPGMIDACIDVLSKNGMQENNIFYDKFT